MKRRMEPLIRVRVEVGNERCKSTHDDLKAGGLHEILFDIGKRIVDVPDLSGQSKSAYEVLNLGRICKVGELFELC
jgi:hypothetical protein